MRTNLTARLLLSGVAFAALMGPAMALDATAFVDRVEEVYKTIGYEFSFGPATLNGDTIVVDGVTVSFVGEADMEPVVFDTEITFSGVVEGADGSYTASSVRVPDVDTEFASAPEPVGHLSITDVRADGLYLPAGDTIPAVALLQLVQSISTGRISVTRDGDEVISVESIKASNAFNPSQGSTDLVDVSSTLAVNGIRIDTETLSEDDPDSAEIIEALGLHTIAGTISQDVTWTMADGHMIIKEFVLDFDNLGALNVTADLTGLTPAVLDQIYAMQAQMMASGETPTEEQAQAQMMSGMALMQGVNIVGASVRYDDASLAANLLEYFAKQSGTDRASFVSGLKTMLPAVLAQSGIPALNDLVVPPVSAFLDNPQSLEVKISPPSPTSLLVLMAAAANPAGLITVLGLTVQANQ